MSSEEEEEERWNRMDWYRTLRHVHQIPGEQLKTSPDSLPALNRSPGIANLGHAGTLLCTFQYGHVL